MVKKVLQLLANGEAVNTAQISAILGASEAAVEAALAELQAEKLLLGWRPILHPKAHDGDSVQALIEVKVMPEREGGFNKVAERIARFDQVETCYLMSGGYDLMVVVKGHNLLEIATFVAEKLSTIDRVQSTATRFMLRCYKESGFLIETQPDELQRPAVSP
ncbi:MAG: Lrp/AsnC family transcriptional regulator [Verrucomicrobiota bacterium JB022]|nr:Lrp/AsnC family transcriptional regulator [Verrucomicrobiota bacterium JB022]